MGTFQESVVVRNARLDAIATAIGATAVLKLFSGALPANCAAADPSGLLATLTLPATYLSSASAGVKSKTGSWTGTGSANGTAACFRIYDSGGTVCGVQGDVSTVTDGTGAMQLDNTAIANTQAVSINAFTITAGNA